MEKWKSRGKGTKAESVLPPTRRPAGPACLPIMDKKKDRKWSFGNLLRRISSGQQQDASSNDEDITYIPGHMLSKRSTRKPSRMKSKLGKIPHRAENTEIPAPREEFSGSRDTLEIIRSLKANVEQSQDSLCPCNDSVNSRSSEGSLDAAGKASRINRMKARAQAKRDRLRGDSSSDDDSHRSSQSLGQLRGDETAPITRGSSRKTDPCAARRTRGARTERYVRRMYRDDGTSGSESRILESSVIPSPSCDSAPSRFSTTSVDSTFLRAKLPAPEIQGGSSPSIAIQRDVVLEKKLPMREIFRHPPEPRASPRATTGYLRDMNENETFEREKLTWPQPLRRATPTNGVYGSLGQPKFPPPEPPPRSSKSRVFSSFYANSPCVFNAGHEVQPAASYPSPLGTRNPRTCNSDNEILLSDHVAPVRLRHLWANSDDNRREARVEPETPYYSATTYCNSLDRPRRPNYSPATRRTREFREEQENCDPRPYHEVVPPPSNFAARSTSSLPKGVQLFSRQRLSHCGGDDDVFLAAPSLRSPSPNPSEKPLEDRIIPKLRGPRAPASCRNPTRTSADDEAERKRSSKNLEDALSELEAIYNSLRLSDEDLLERAEQRSMEEYRDRAARSAAENSRRSSDTSSIDVEDGGRRGSSGSSQQQQQREDARMKDDMAYRRMNPKERPPSVNGQASLSQISYLATSPNLSIRDADYLDQRPRSRRGTPDPTRDDLLYRSISRANNQLRVIEPQPPFGIPLGPVTAATESDYLHAKPAKLGGGHTRSLYIPQAEPDVVSDDLAFRNLRKDAPKDVQIVGFAGNRAEPFSQADSNAEFFPRNITGSGSSKKRATRSMSADLYGIVGRERSKQSDWYSDYIQSTQKLRFVGDDFDVAPVASKENFRGFEAPRSKSPMNGESGEAFPGEVDRLGLDINGNRPKSALQRKIQVYVPQETAIAENIDAKLEKPREGKSIGRESEGSSPERCDSRSSSRSDVPAVLEDEKTKIESFTEQELSEYKQLCQDLEKLIQRTAEPDAKEIEEEEEEDEEKKIVRESEEDEDSQSEFDELEKLLIDDYELPASIAAAFDEIVEATSVGRDDDGSSSRSTGLGADSLSSDNFQSSPGKMADRIIPEDDASSASELGTASSGNTGSSFNDSVYDKFNQLLREVNDVPYVEPKKTFAKYPVDELDATSNIPASGSNDDAAAEGPGVAATAEETRETSATREDPEAKTEATGRDEHPAEPETPWRGLRARRTVEEEEERDGDERKVERRDKPANRQGEKNVEGDARARDDGLLACNETSKRTVSNLCRVTNRVTAYHIVLCSLFLTLLITTIVAQ